jgi:hypothetical protein
MTKNGWSHNFARLSYVIFLPRKRSELCIGDASQVFSLLERDIAVFEFRPKTQGLLLANFCLASLRNTTRTQKKCLAKQ